MNDLSRVVPVYVRCLLAIQISLLAFAFLALINLALHLGDFSRYLGRLPFAAFLSSIPVLFPAEERNVWKNEFLRCPLWMRVACVVAMAYGFVAAGLTASQSPRFEDDPVFTSAISFFTVPMTVVILVSVLRTGLSGDEALMRYCI